MNATARLAFTRGALLLMEALWVYALVAFLVAVTVGGGRPTLLGVGAVVAVSFTISRFLQQSDLSLGVLRIWGVALSLLVFYVIVRVDFFHDLRLWDFTWVDKLVLDTEAALRGDEAKAAVVGVPLLWLFWLRGVLRGQQHIDFESVVGRFAVGVVVVAFVEAFIGAVDAPAAVGYVAVPYIAVGLLAIGTTQAARGDDDDSRPFATTWFGVIGAAIMLLSVIGVLFALADLGLLARGLGEASEAAGAIIARIVYFILYPIILATVVMFEVLKYIWQELYGGRVRTEDLIPQATPTPTEDESSPAPLPGWAAWVLRFVIGVPLVVAVLVGLAFLFTKYARRAEPQETKESTYQEGRLAADLGDLLGSFLNRLRPGHGREALDPARRLYFDMLRAGEQRDVARKPAETPLELSPRLERAFAGPTPRRITALFDDVRYGGLPPAASEVEAARHEWEELRKG